MGQTSAWLQGQWQAPLLSRWRVLWGYCSVFRPLPLAQAALKAGSTEPCSQPLASQGHAEVVRSESSFLLLQILAQSSLTSYTIINHGWSAGLAFLWNTTPTSGACSAVQLFHPRSLPFEQYLCLKKTIWRGSFLTFIILIQLIIDKRNHNAISGDTYANQTYKWKCSRQVLSNCFL